MIGIACAHVACGRVFEPASARQSYCSTVCRHAAYNARDRANSRVGDRQVVPHQPAEMGPLRQLYETKCLSCGRGAFVSLDPAQARGLRALPRCTTCGGVCHLEMVLLTSNRRVW